MGLIDQAGRASSTTVYRVPPPDLAPVVVEGWIQGYTGDIRNEVEAWRVVPDLQPHLIVHRAPGGSPRGPRVVGARSIWVDVPVAAREWSAGVTLRPGALPVLTGLPASDLTDRSASADDVWGGQGLRLGRAIAGTSTPHEVMDLLFAFVRERVPRPMAARDWRIRGFSALAGRAPAPGIAHIAHELGVAPRTLRQVWRREVGLSPREALSIGRVHRAVSEALVDPGRVRWSRLAAGAGFYDQAHMIRDFHRFLGETPERFLARGSPPAP